MEIAPPLHGFREFSRTQLPGPFRVLGNGEASRGREARRRGLAHAIEEAREGQGGEGAEEEGSVQGTIFSGARGGAFTSSVTVVKAST